MRITPNYELLRNYLPLVQEAKYLWQYDFLLRNVKDFEKNFTKLLNDHELTDHCYNLLYFAGGYAARISQFSNDIENWGQNPFEEHNKDLQILKQFIAGRKCHEIKFISPTNTINLKSEYLIAGIMQLIGKYYELKNEYPQPVEPIPDPPQKDSYYKTFCNQILKELFTYLKSETNFNTKSNNDTFKFIVEFMTILNLNWDKISEFPDEYLKDRYKKQKIKK